MNIAARLVLTASIALVLPTAAHAQTYQINVGHVLNKQSSYQVGIERFAELMAQRTGGAFKVNIFPSAGLGGELRLVQGGTTGTVDAFMIGQPSLEATIPEYKILSLPYLFDSEAQAVAVLGGTFGQKFLDLLPKYNMVGLGWAGVFSRGLPARKSVERVRDMNGMKVRVMQSPGYLETFKAFGSQSTPIPFGELFMALQTGVVDAADLSPDLVISGQFTNAITHYSRIGTHQLPSLFIMSKARFDSFPPNIRALVLDAGREASVAASEEQRRSQAAGLEQMRAAGIVITSPDLSTFREAGRKAWPAILANVPKADEYLAELKVAQKGK